jgi:hypothetical protein
MPNPLPRGYDDIARAVLAFGRYRKRWRILHGLGRAVLLGPGALLAWGLVDAALPLPAWLLLISFAAVVGLGLWTAVRRLLVPLFSRVHPAREALLVEALHGKLDNQVIGSLQLGREVAEATPDSPLGYSRVLVDELVARTAGRLQATSLPALLDLRQARRVVAGAAGAAVLIAGVVIAWPQFIRDRAAHLADAYAIVMDALFPVEMTVTSGDLRVVRGNPARLGVDIRGARRRNVTLTRTPLEEGTPTTDSLMLAGQHAGFDIAAAEASFTYAFTYAGRSTEPHTVLVGDLPEISAVNYELMYPVYAGVPPRTLVGRLPRLQALRGTAATVSLAATTELHPEYCYVEWQDGSRQPLSISGRFGHFSFTMDRPDRASVHLTGSLGPGFEMAQPFSFEIVVQADQPPSVEVLLKERKLVLLQEAAAHWGLNYIAEDDFGVGEIILDYRIDTIDPLLNRAPRQGTLSRLIEPARDRVRGGFQDLFKDAAPPLEPGDRITVTVSARDNNTETGPNLGRSPPIEIVVVRPDLAGFREQNFGFGADSLLAGLRKVKRATNLLLDPEKVVRTETRRDIERQDLKSRVSQESWPSGAEDAIGDYFRLLSGER